MRHTRTEIAKQEAEESIEELNGIEVGGHSSQPHTLFEFCLNMTLGQAGREFDSVWRLRMPSNTSDRAPWDGSFGKGQRNDWSDVFFGMRSRRTQLDLLASLCSVKCLDRANALSKMSTLWNSLCHFLSLPSYCSIRCLVWSKVK